MFTYTVRKQQLQIVTNKKQRQASASLLTRGQQYPAHWLRCHALLQHLTLIVSLFCRVCCGETR